MEFEHPISPGSQGSYMLSQDVREGCIQIPETQERIKLKRNIGYVKQEIVIVYASTKGFTDNGFSTLSSLFRLFDSRFLDQVVYSSADVTWRKSISAWHKGEAILLRSLIK